MDKIIASATPSNCLRSAERLNETRRGLTAGKPISVCLLISSLEFGGAERQVVEMVRSFNHEHIKPFICSLSPEVPLASALPNPVEELVVVEKRNRFDITTIFRVARLLRQRHVNVVHAFLLDAEIVARLAAPLAGVPVVVASERNTDYVRPWLHTAALKLTQPLFDVLVANSVAGKNFSRLTLGLSDSRLEVVHNGVDVERFNVDYQAGLAFRQKLGIPLQDPLVGMVASFKRQKGHDHFLRMAGRIRESNPDAWFILVGEPVRDNYQATSRCESEAKELAAALKLGDHCRFLGNQKDMKAVYNACDLTVLLSLREGTPNVVLESMACGVPVIASDVADNSLIILHQQTGFVVPCGNSQAAADHALHLLGRPEERMKMSQSARLHVCRNFSLQCAANKLQAIYERCLAQKGKWSEHGHTS